jgi:hypothetical protein
LKVFWRGREVYPRLRLARLDLVVEVARRYFVVDIRWIGTRLAAGIHIEAGVSILPFRLGSRSCWAAVEVGCIARTIGLALAGMKVLVAFVEAGGG